MMMKEREVMIRVPSRACVFEDLGPPFFVAVSQSPKLSVRDGPSGKSTAGLVEKRLTFQFRRIAPLRQP